MRKTALILTIILLFTLTISGCTSKPKVIEYSSDPLVFASPYLPYIGKTKDELMKDFNLTKDDFLYENDILITLNELVTVDGHEYLVRFDFDGAFITDEQEETGSIPVSGVWYICYFDSPKAEGIHELIENIYNALAAEYGEPVEQSKNIWTVRVYLENDASVPGGYYSDLWIAAESPDFPEGGRVRADYLVVSLRININRGETSVRVGYGVSNFIELYGR